jgi:hypothetical protein
VEYGRGCEHSASIVVVIEQALALGCRKHDEARGVRRERGGGGGGGERTSSRLRDRLCSSGLFVEKVVVVIAE